MVMLVRLLQPLKAFCPIVVTLLGMVMLVRFLQSRKALSAILVPPVITTVFNDAGTTEEFDPPNIYPKLVFEVPVLVLPTNGIVMLSRLLQPLNA
jgi:hypothetical protein